MSKSNLSKTFVHPVAKIHRGDRWSVFRRLKELNISCCCREDGMLWVEIDNGLDAILLRSIVQQFVSNRSELIDWLERCWSSQVLSTSNN